MNLIKNMFMAVTIVIAFTSCSRSSQLIFIEAESFSNQGGWVVDQQVIDQMGSAYMLAHGLGTPVDDAETTIDVPAAGTYRVWVRTRDWVAPWNVTGSPGKFQLLVNNEKVGTTFGTEGAEWHWQDGGQIKLNKGNVKIALHDLTGFAGRCDAIVLSTDIDFMPPVSGEELAEFRRNSLGFQHQPEDAGEYDFIVVGGGMAGCCAALSAARLGSRVALIQNRPVLGGNNSSEVRVGLSGLINQEPYPKLGNLVDEIGPIGFWNLWEAEQNPDLPRSQNILKTIANNPEKKIHNAGPASNYGDEKKKQVIENEDNIQLFLNMHVFDVEKTGDKITAVIGKDINTGKEYRFKGAIFADCTGDGNLGFLADADFRQGRESKEETQEIRAPEQADNLVMGTSVQWYAIEEEHPVSFPECPWAVQFNEETCHKMTRGDWDWETGANRDQIKEIEIIRDYAFRVTYGNWDFIKNKSIYKDDFENQRLEWVAYIGGKRESRRLMGDIILKEQDILNKTKFEDACFTTTWGIDLHYPVSSEGFYGEPFRSRADYLEIEPYAVPYRCLYSRNVSNLMMAGRNISVTHVALGTVRVMRTTGMMGEVVGMAASICNDKNTTPRGVFDNYLPELKNLMNMGVGNTN